MKAEVILISLSFRVIHSQRGMVQTKVSWKPATEGTLLCSIVNWGDNISSIFKILYYDLTATVLMRAQCPTSYQTSRVYCVKLVSPMLFVTVMKCVKKSMKLHTNIRKILLEGKSTHNISECGWHVIILTDSECSIQPPVTKSQHSVGKPARITKNKTESLLLSRFSSSSLFKDWKYKMVKKGMKYSWVFLLWKTWSKWTENSN